MPFNIRNRAALPLAVFLLSMVLASIAGAGAMPENKPGPGDAAPVFVVTSLNGDRVSLEELTKAGKIVFLNFWGLRCSSCVEEIGYLNPLFDQYSSKGVVFLGVNVDGVKPEMIRKQMPGMQNSPKFTVLPDPEFKIPDMYNLAGAPLSFVIGKDGRIQYRHEDFKAGDEKELEEALKKALVSK
ncbi:MAG TPA: TlpA disulfide reductase family protein [Candidatus Deferrimicrobiaceae bacterium]|jgi:peroxiredoxin